MARHLTTVGEKGIHAGHGNHHPSPRNANAYIPWAKVIRNCEISAKFSLKKLVFILHHPSFASVQGLVKRYILLSASPVSARKTFLKQTGTKRKTPNNLAVSRHSVPHPQAFGMKKMQKTAQKKTPFPPNLHQSYSQLAPYYTPSYTRKAKHIKAVFRKGVGNVGFFLAVF